MHISFRNLINKTLVLFSINLVGCASDDSLSSHISLSDRIKERTAVDVIFVDFQPTRIFVGDKISCQSSLKNCVIGSVLEKSILFATGTNKVISDQKTSQEKILSQKIKNAYGRSGVVDHFFTTLASDTTKCGIRLNIGQSIAIKNEDLGGISGITGLRWRLGGAESTEQARMIILPKISNISHENSIILLVVISEINVLLGAENEI